MRTASPIRNRRRKVSEFSIPANQLFYIRSRVSNDTEHFDLNDSSKHNGQDNLNYTAMNIRRQSRYEDDVSKWDSCSDIDHTDTESKSQNSTTKAKKSCKQWLKLIFWYWCMDDEPQKDCCNHHH